MENTNTNRYATGVILSAMVVFFGGFVFIHGVFTAARSNAEFDMSYSMPRPKKALYNFFFGLEERELEYKEINPFKDKTAGGKAKTAGVGSHKDLPKIDTKKTDAKKAAQKNATTTVPKKTEVKVNIINADPQSPLVAGRASVEESIQTGGASAQGLAIAQAGVGVKRAVDTLSAAQWRSLVLGQPTKENVMKLIAGFNNKEVDSSTLYQIMNDLMQSSNTETQGLGLMIGENIPSLKSFSIVSDNYEKFDATTKKSADMYFMTYMQSSKLEILALALRSNDSQVVSRAAQVMVAGLEQVKSSQNTGAGRYDSGRGVVASNTSKSYTQFVAIFQDLVKSPDSTLAGLAQNALTQIQSLSNT